VISRIEALNFRCLRYVSQDIGPFHVLVGPNASGKTTFLDVVALLGKLVADGPEAAIRERTSDFRDIATGRVAARVELAIEARIPERLVVRSSDAPYDVVRYEVALGVGDTGDDVQSPASRGRPRSTRPSRARLPSTDVKTLRSGSSAP
jgi:ABC-type phosphonate transport system ATPase subunit